MRIEYTIEIEEDAMAVRGNAMASGDDAADREVENEILDRLRRGDTWAWATVTVSAEVDGFRGTAQLGGCSYRDETDFREGGYFADMCIEARHELRAKLETAVSALASIPEDEWTRDLRSEGGAS